MRFEGATLETLGPQLRKQLEVDTNFFFVGPFGTGKTWAMAATARHWAVQMRQTWLPQPYRPYATEVFDFIWTTESLLWGQVRSSWSNRAGPSESYLLDTVSACRLLCIDDIGKASHAAPESYKSFLYDLVNRRSVSSNKTFLTSNLDAGEMERLCPAAVDRIREMCVVIEMTGPSRRRPAGKLTVKEDRK